VDALLVLFVSALSLAVVLTVTGVISPVVVAASSMEPTLPRGALVVFVKQGDYSAGDVVLFKVHGRLVAHRIVAETERGFRTRGDNSRSVDPWVVPPDAVRGKALLAAPFLGSLVMLMRTPIVFAGIVTAIFASLTWRELLGEPARGKVPAKH